MEDQRRSAGEHRGREEDEQGGQEDEAARPRKEVKPQVERVGAVPELPVELVEGLEEKDLREHGLELSRQVPAWGMRPPVQLLEHGATVLHALGVFMGHGIELPPQVDRGARVPPRPHGAGDDEDRYRETYDDVD